jgi:hypothetical protein
MNSKICDKYYKYKFLKYKFKIENLSEIVKNNGDNANNIEDNDIFSDTSSENEINDENDNNNLDILNQILNSELHPKDEHFSFDYKTNMILTKDLNETEETKKEDSK